MHIHIHVQLPMYTPAHAHMQYTYTYTCIVETGLRSAGKCCSADAQGRDRQSRWLSFQV